MSFSYSGDPLRSIVDQIRYLIDDRDPPPFLEDEEIQYQAGQLTNPFRAAAACADQIATQLGKRAATKSVGGISLTRPDLRRSYVELAARLRRRALTEKELVVSCGGLSRGEKADQMTDADAEQPVFRKRTGSAGQDPRQGWN